MNINLVKYSTEFAIFEISNLLSKSLDMNKYALGFYLDLTKAFDTVDHGILLKKLYHYGIRGITHKWFSSYLSSRTHAVCIDGNLSEYHYIKCGIPQGSILGPLLFLIYINDLSNASKTLFFRMFADDTACFLDDSNINNLINTFQEELSKISNWMRVNKLSINIDKTKYMIFHSPRQKIPSNIKLYLDNEEIEQVDNIKYLGIIFDNNLNWKCHLSTLSKKIAKSIGIFYKLRYYLDEDVVRKIYFAVIYPHLLYGINTWGCARQSFLKPIQIKMNKIIRIITFSNLREHSLPLFRRCEILRLDEIFCLQCVKMMYKYHHNLLPRSISDCLRTFSHGLNTRFNTINYQNRNFNTNYGKYSPSNFCISLWSALLDDIKNLPFHAFKGYVMEILTADLT